ncbi:uncharacterized protein LOC135501994 [Lineus longissimus]|uniref:uncharacterized protein LOC135501994 n=1 Tax=Lineus longissimus TaxID=88925 RepID=UPI002B4D12CF
MDDTILTDDSDDDLPFGEDHLDEFEPSDDDDPSLEPTTMSEESRPDILDSNESSSRRLLPVGYHKQFEQGLCEEMTNMVDEEFVVCSTSKLKTLFNDRFSDLKECCICGDVSKTTQTPIGGTMIFHRRCQKGHVAAKFKTSWKVSNVYIANLLMCSAVTMTGNNFTKVAMWAKFVKLVFPSITTFTRLQAAYVNPVVERFWGTTQEMMLSALHGIPVDICGDGRCDSPGFSAHYCQYVFQEALAGYIVHLMTVDKRQVQGKSLTMERYGAFHGLAFLVSKIKIATFTTDDNPMVRSCFGDTEKSREKLKSNFPELTAAAIDAIQGIRHYLDTWHRTKKIGAALSKAGKGKSKVLDWVKPVVNHFWHCCQSCEGNVDTLRESWLALLYHVQGIHEWATGQCSHGPSDEENEALRDGASVDTVRSVVTDKKLMKELHYYTGFHHTGPLENFNGLITMYASKRTHFEYNTMLTRTKLAAIDYNHYIHRKVKKHDDRLVVTKGYSKGGARWVLRYKKEPKDYDYHRSSEYMLLLERRDHPSRLKARVELPPDHPKHIAPNIAPVQGITTADIVEKKKSRLGN